MNAEQTRAIYVSEEDNRSPECKRWMKKIGEDIQVQAKTNHSMRYVFPSFSQSLELYTDDEFGPELLDVTRYHTHPGCVDTIKQRLRDQGCTVSRGYYRVDNTPSQDQDFLDIAWNPGWWDTYYDWKDRWWGSLKSERG
jgi:hypothetical protein